MTALAMAEAWRTYLGHYRARPHIPFRFDRAEFTFHLRCAWDRIRLGWPEVCRRQEELARRMG